jgi:predicted nucleic acid-binding protein
VVSNSTPLIFLAKIGRLNLLEKIFDAVIIPDKVFSEVVIEGKEKGYSDAFLVEKFINKGIISKKNIKIKSLNDMPIGKGEQEAIELAVKLGIQDILIDEAKGRRFARLYDLQPKGTLWVLTKAFEDDLLSKDELKDNITELIKCGFRIKEDILVDILKELM